MPRRYRRRLAKGGGAVKTIREHLDDFDTSDLEQLARHLWVNADGAVRSFHMNKIVTILTNWKLFSEKVLKYLPTDVQEKLPRLAFEPGPHRDEPILHRYGVLFNGFVPDDVQAMLQQRYKSHVVRDLPEVKVSNRWNSYVKLLLLLHLLNQQPKKQISKRTFEDKLHGHGLVPADVDLLRRGLTRRGLVKENQKSQRLVLDAYAYETWTEN